MAYTLEITKGSVQQINPTEYNVSVNAVFKEDGTEVFNSVYSKRYVQGTPVSSIKTALQKQMQADWDQYKAERAIFDNAQFATMCGEIQTAGNTYINL